MKVHGRPRLQAEPQQGRKKVGLHMRHHLGRLENRWVNFAEVLGFR